MTKDDFSDFRIRLAGPNDFHHVLGIEQQCWEEPWTREDMQLIFDEPSWVKVVLTRSFKDPHSGNRHETLPGYMVFTGNREEKSLSVLNISVLPQCRRRGLGTKLVRYAEAHLQGDFRQVTAMCSEASLEVQLFLQSCGWRCVQIIHKKYGDDAGYIFRKRKTESLIVDEHFA